MSLTAAQQANWESMGWFQTGTSPVNTPFAVAQRIEINFGDEWIVRWHFQNATKNSNEIAFAEDAIVIPRSLDLADLSTQSANHAAIKLLCSLGNTQRIAELAIPVRLKPVGRSRR